MLTFNNDDYDSDDIETPTWGKGDIREASNTKSSSIKGKILFVIILGVAFAFAGWLAFNPIDEEEVFTPSPNKYVAELNELEKKKDYVNLIKALYENTTPEYSKAVLPWLKKREDSGFTPYLYATARHMLITDETYQALLYYSAAGLAARVDAARCSDRTTASWVAFLENGFSGVHEYMNAHPESKATAGKWALMKEETLKGRDLPAWMCLNGEKTSEYVPYVPEELWQQERIQIRNAFDQFTQSGTITETAPASGK
jgi:hypothetical protein